MNSTVNQDIPAANSFLQTTSSSAESSPCPGPNQSPSKRKRTTESLSPSVSSPTKRQRNLQKRNSPVSESKKEGASRYNFAPIDRKNVLQGSNGAEESVALYKATVAETLFQIARNTSSPEILDLIEAYKQHVDEELPSVPPVSPSSGPRI